MSTYTEHCYCRCCDTRTKHVVVQVAKQSAFEGQPNQSRKEFIAGMIKGWFLGPFISSCDEYELHRICESCGTKYVQE